MNDLIIKKISTDIYQFSIGTGSSRWNFSIYNYENASVGGAWVRVGGCGSVPIKTRNQQHLWAAVLTKLAGEYNREICLDGEPR